MINGQSNKSFSIVIPCYNCANNINKVVTEIITVLSDHNINQYDIVLINDFSNDNTWDVLLSLAKNNNHFIAISLAKNFGQHAALMAGLKYAKNEYVVLMDDDGQTDPSQMFKLVDKLEEGHDVVYARYNHKMHSGFRKIGTIINDKMAQALLKKPKDVYLSSYIIMKQFINQEVLKYDNPFPYLDGLILRTTGNVVSVDVEHKSRMEGHSGYTFKKLLGLWINGFTAFSIIPLRISMFFGFAFAILGFLVGLYSIINKIISPDVAVGWTSLISVVSIIGGITLTILGMIGEYIGRIYISLNKSPQYVIREIVNEHSDIKF